ncbi:MAG: protein serine/threonine phosphatase 2C family protein [Deltaproteobacteria bacterium]|nr:protein serine/threonine phosphatase 2C family protein [Deltaproteobacteria bacterium]MBW2116983.1 protein serine/threonine phosphatase 2C family protein [Deltaproteobacteria bacterium]MBW2343461.1 protein serine/threonine phosphatase 2C family protein [Deltaproteobacteria bacterium]
MENLYFAFKTDVGKDSTEKCDSFLCNDNLFIVVGGSGGGNFRDIAKERACEVINKSFFKNLSEVHSPDKALMRALDDTNREILKERKKIRHKMAASVSVAYIADDMMFFTHLGDSRIYTLRGKQLAQLTRDQTILEKERYAEQRLHDPRLEHAFTEGLGIHERPDIQVMKFALQQKDLILMTTECLTKRVSNREILRLSLKIRNLKKLCIRLIDETRRRGEESNVTVGVVRYDKFFRGQLKKVMAIFVTALLVISAIVGYDALKYRLKGTEDYQNEDIKAVQETSVKQKESLSVNKVNVSPGHQAKISQTGKKSKEQKAIIQKSTEQQAVATSYDEIYAFINKWKKAWENTAGRKGEIQSYISCYSDDFVSKGLHKTGWRHDKAVKGRTKRWIRLKLKDIRIVEARSDSRVEVRFLQNYRSSNYSGSSKKKLVLIKERTGWKIFAEKTY